MAKVEVYFKDWCAYSKAALSLLREKGVQYTLHDVTQDEALEEEMRTRSGRRTVPQIFIDERHVGGFDDLAALDVEGLLDSLLGLSGGPPNPKNNSEAVRGHGSGTGTSYLTGTPITENVDDNSNHTNQ